MRTKPQCPSFVWKTAAQCPSFCSHRAAMPLFYLENRSPERYQPPGRNAPRLSASLMFGRGFFAVETTRATATANWHFETNPPYKTLVPNVLKNHKSHGNHEDHGANFRKQPLIKTTPFRCSDTITHTKKVPREFPNKFGSVILSQTLPNIFPTHLGKVDPGIR